MPRSPTFLFHSIVLCATLGTALPAYTQEATVQIDMAAVEEAWKRGDFIFARQGLAELAETLGTPLAQYRYGRILVEGRGGAADITQGIKWLQKSVDQNHAEAATLLARVLLSIPAPNRDPERSATLFSNAAARGNAEAQYYLGLFYKTGQGGIAQDEIAAFNWFLAGSEGGNKEAQFELARAYSQGSGTTQNNTESLRWLTESANNGQTDAEYSLAAAYDTGAGVGQSDAEAAEWFHRAAESGHILSQRDLGTKYLQGNSALKPDAAKALRWLEAAAKAGDPGAMYNLAVSYAAGTTLPKDDTKAFSFFQNASDRKLPRATLALAGMVEAGRGTTASLEKAIPLYELAGQQGSSKAALRLAALTISGALDDVATPYQATPWVMTAVRAGDENAISWMLAQAQEGVRPAQAAFGQWLLGQTGQAEEGITLMKQAALSGHVPSQFRLGEAYTTGDGANLDYVQAHAWLNIAAASGHEKARDTRGILNDLMTADQIAQAQRITRTFFEDAAKLVPNTSQTVTRVSE
ncbi:MAG: TPR repeat protein [Candidatus Azotimanducaceae bacterium]|jgi:TPR repeat protein